MRCPPATALVGKWFDQSAASVKRRPFCNGSMSRFMRINRATEFAIARFLARRAPPIRARSERASSVLVGAPDAHAPRRLSARSSHPRVDAVSYWPILSGKQPSRQSLPRGLYAHKSRRNSGDHQAFAANSCHAAGDARVNEYSGPGPTRMHSKWRRVLAKPLKRAARPSGYHFAAIEAFSARHRRNRSADATPPHSLPRASESPSPRPRPLCA